MGNLLHVCLYNADAEASLELTTPIRALNFVRLVAEVGAPDKLADVLNTTEINLVFFHLDSDPELVVDVIEQVSTRYPELALVAISSQSDPEAILLPMRAGCDQFVCRPIDAADLASAVSRVASKRLFSQPKSRCICVTPASGGAGATSIACNLALEIGLLTERDCALVDLDLQFGDTALNFDCHPKYTMFDLASVGTDVDQSAIDSALQKLSCKVALLSRPESVDQHDTITADSVNRVLEMLMNDYENIVIDVPRDVTPVTVAAFAHADIILIVCQLLVPSIHNAKRYYEALINLGIPDERIEVVVNRHDSRSKRVSAEDIRETIDKEVFANIPNDYQFVARSIDFGRPIAALDRNNPVRAAIREMAAKLTAPTSSDKPAKERGGFIKRLLSR